MVSDRELTNTGVPGARPQASPLQDPLVENAQSQHGRSRGRARVTRLEGGGPTLPKHHRYGTNTRCAHERAAHTINAVRVLGVLVADQRSMDTRLSRHDVRSEENVMLRRRDKDRIGDDARLQA